MSIPLPNVDLSAAVVGSTGSINLQNVGIGTGGVTSDPSTINNNANLWLFNDSGCGLTITFKQGMGGFKLPAGGWTTAPLSPGEYELDWSVDYLITNAPVSILMSTYYAPGEAIPQQVTLGNSPVGGAVATSGGGGVANQLINTGNPAASTDIIDIEQAGASGPQMITDNQGNFQISQYVASVLTTIFRTIAGVATNGANVLISDSNHMAQVQGLLNVLGVTQAQGQINAYAANNGAAAIYINGFNAGGIGVQAAANVGDTGNYIGFYAVGGGGAGAASAGVYITGNWGRGIDLTAMNAPSAGFVAGANNSPALDLSRVNSANVSILFPNGGTNNKLNRMQIIPGITVNNGASQVVSHNLGVVPLAIIMCIQGTTNGNFNVSADTNGGSTTSFKVATSNASPVTPVTAILMA